MSAPVLFHDFTHIEERRRAGLLAAMARVLDSGWFILGPEVEAFERSWADSCGAAYCVGVGNGLDAIEIGLRSLGIGPGDEVITTPMTAVASVLAILRAGATPVLADIDPTTGLLDPASVVRCLSPRTSAIMPVHLYGHVRAMDTWKELAQQSSAVLVEDCAQSHLAREDEVAAGTFGAFGAFSFYPTKNLGAVGDAGALVTDDGDLAQRAQALRNYGQTERYHHDFVGLNSRLDELQAALLSARLEDLLQDTQRRRAIAKTYRHEIDSMVVEMLEEPRQEEAHVYHLFVVLSDHRDELREHLAGQGIQTLVHYPVPVHRQAPFSDLPRDPHGLPGAENHARRCVSLPCAPHLTNEEIGRVVEAVNAFVPST